MTISQEALKARIALVEQHIRSENRHHLQAIMETFGEEARYDDEPWGDHRVGNDGVRSYYEDLILALPDLQIEVHRRHVSDNHIVLEVEISGTHTAALSSTSTAMATDGVHPWVPAGGRTRRKSSAAAPISVERRGPWASRAA